MSTAVFHFHQPLSGEVDKQNKIIYGVAVITGGVEARGHSLEIDDKTLDQVIECGKRAKQVQVKYNHRSGVENIGGYLDNFRKSADGTKAIADWHLLDTHEETEKTLEKAEKMPGCFGLSAAFNGPKKGERVGKKNFARCTSLEAVDCVASPAANPTGLFEAKVDTSGEENPTNMSKPTAAKPAPAAVEPAAEPTLKDILDAVKAQGETINGLVERIDTLEAGKEPLSKDELEELNGLTDEQLAEAGLTREQITEALAAVDAPAATHESPADAGAGAGAGAATAAQATAQTALNTAKKLLDRVIRLEAKEANAAQEAEDAEAKHAFETIENKLTELGEINIELSTENQVLRSRLRRNGITAAAPGAETVRLFSAKKGDGSTAFEQHVTHLLETANTAGKPISRSAAIALAVREKPEDYLAYRNREKEQG